MKFVLIALLLFKTVLFSSEYSLVFIHIGPSIPHYAEEALKQARLFNPDCPIYLIASKAALHHFPLPQTVEQVAYETLKPTLEHQQYSKYCKRKPGFWRFTSERFLYLNDFVHQKGLKNVFHLENDVMLYVNLETLLPVFKANYQGLGATFDNDERCIPGFIYIQSQDALHSLANLFTLYARSSFNDMVILSLFQKMSPESIGSLPVTTLEYVNQNAMVSPHGHKTSDRYKYCQHLDEFDSIFDAAAIGQFLGGDNGHFGAGFINESTLYNPSAFTYEFILDEKGRLVPYATYAGKTYRINTLHIHSKDLKRFSSLQKKSPN